MLQELLLIIFFYVDCPEILKLVCKRWKLILEKYPQRSGLKSILKRGDIRIFEYFSCNIPKNNLVPYSHVNFLDLWKDFLDLGDALLFERSVGDLEVVKWLYKNNCSWDSYVFARAVKIGNIEVLDWLLKHNCPYNYTAYNEAIKIGNIEIIEWLLENKCVIDHLALHVAVRFRKIDILKLLLKYNFPLDSWLFSSAIETKNIEVLEWLLKNKCPYIKNELHSDDPLIMKWIQDNL